MNRLSHLTEVQLDISQFVEYIHETYQQMHSMWIGDYTFTQVQLIPGISSVSSKDLSVFVKDFSEFPSFSTLLIDGFLSLCLFDFKEFVMILSLVILTNFYNKCLYLCRFLYTTLLNFQT